MEVEISCTENPERVQENISKRIESSRIEEGRIIAETEKIEFLERTPGVKSYSCNEVSYRGIGGRPVKEEAYAKLESVEDAVRCLLATVEGYDLRILNTDREWDLKQLKRYNPDIKHLKFDEPRDFLNIDTAISDVNGIERTEIEMPEEDEIRFIYRKKLT